MSVTKERVVIVVLFAFVLNALGARCAAAPLPSSATSSGSSASHGAVSASVENLAETAVGAQWETDEEGRRTEAAAKGETALAVVLIGAVVAATVVTIAVSTGGSGA